MWVGYARVSTTDQSPELQLDVLRRAGCEKIHTEKASGAKVDRPVLARVLDDVLRRGDVLVVWKLDRLARALKKLITTAEELAERGIGLVSLACPAAAASLLIGFSKPARRMASRRLTSSIRKQST